MRFFSGDNMVFRFCERLFDLVLLSAAWAMLCIPIVTIGPATTALYYAAVKCVRRNEQGAMRNFFQSFRQNFKVGAIAGVITVVCGVLLFFSGNVLAIMARAGDSLGVVLYYAQRVFILFLLGLACWLFPILSRFTVQVPGLFAAAVQLGARHLPTTVVVGLLVMEGAQLILRYGFPILIVPGLAALLASLFYERVFIRYTLDEEGTGPDEDGKRPWYLQ